MAAIDPDVLPTATARSFWERFGGGAFVVSLALHALIALAAGYYVVTEIVVKQFTTFEAQEAPTATVEQEVRHRVALARRASGGGGMGEMNVTRIVTEAAGGFALPTTTELPKLGMGGGTGGVFGGGGGGGRGIGGGLGFGGGTRGVAGSTRDVMSIFGSVRTVTESRRLVFLVECTDDMLTPIKGGFDAFEIVRSEVRNLVTRLSLSTEFNVILYDSNRINAFRPAVVPATVANKTALIGWINALNTDPSNRGARLDNVTPRDTSFAEHEIGRVRMVRALQAAAEMGGENLFLVSGNWPWFGRSTYANVRDQREAEERNAEVDRENTPEVVRAREAELARARTQLERVNADLKTKGRSPIIVTRWHEIDRKEYQDAFRAAGVPPIRLNTAGWQRKDGTAIWGWKSNPGGYSAEEVVKFVRDLLRAVSKEPVSITVALFVGPDDKQEGAQESFTLLTRAHRGQFRVLDFDDLKAIVRERQTAAADGG